MYFFQLIWWSCCCFTCVIVWLFAVNVPEWIFSLEVLTWVRGEGRCRRTVLLGAVSGPAPHWGHEDSADGADWSMFELVHRLDNWCLQMVRTGSARTSPRCCCCCCSQPSPLLFFLLWKHFGFKSDQLISYLFIFLSFCLSNFFFMSLPWAFR